MNIWITDKSPFLSAQNLDDVTLRKAMLDCAVLISTVTAADGWGAAYTPCDINQPSVRWLRNDKQNFYWLVAHGYAMLAEHQERFGVVHASHSMMFQVMEVYEYTTPKVKAFQNNARDVRHWIDFTYLQDPITAYRLLFDRQWNREIREHQANPRKRLPKWTGLKPPDWYCIEEV